MAAKTKKVDGEVPVRRRRRKRDVFKEDPRDESLVHEKSPWSADFEVPSGEELSVFWATAHAEETIARTPLIESQAGFKAWINEDSKHVEKSPDEANPVFLRRKNTALRKAYKALKGDNLRLVQTLRGMHNGEAILHMHEAVGLLMKGLSKAEKELRQCRVLLKAAEANRDHYMLELKGGLESGKISPGLAEEVPAAVAAAAAAAKKASEAAHAQATAAGGASTRGAGGGGGATSASVMGRAVPPGTTCSAGVEADNEAGWAKQALGPVETISHHQREGEATAAAAAAAAPKDPAPSKEGLQGKGFISNKRSQVKSSRALCSGRTVKNPRPANALSTPSGTRKVPTDASVTSGSDGGVGGDLRSRSIKTNLSRGSAHDGATGGGSSGSSLANAGPNNSGDEDSDETESETEEELVVGRKVGGGGGGGGNQRDWAGKARDESSDTSATESESEPERKASARKRLRGRSNRPVAAPPEPKKDGPRAGEGLLKIEGRGGGGRGANLEEETDSEGETEAGGDAGGLGSALNVPESPLGYQDTENGEEDSDNAPSMFF